MVWRRRGPAARGGGGGHIRARAARPRREGEDQGGRQREGAVAVAHRDGAGDDVRGVAGDASAVEGGVLDGRRDHGDLRRGGAAGEAHEGGGGDGDLLGAL